MTDVESATFYYYVLGTLAFTHLQRKYIEERKKDRKKERKEKVDRSFTKDSSSL